jgi:hypothetical protein
VGRRRGAGTVGGRREEERSEPQMGGADGRVGGIEQGRRSSENERRERYRYVVVVRDVSVHRIERRHAAGRDMRLTGGKSCRRARCGGEGQRGPCEVSRRRKSAKARQVRAHITEDVEGHRKHDRQRCGRCRAGSTAQVQRRVLFKFLDCTRVLAPNVPRRI